MAGPRNEVIEENDDPASGERHRISHRGSGRHAFYQVEAFNEGRPSWDAQEWVGVGGTHASLDAAREGSRLRHLHVVELRDLPRPEVGSRSGTRTPWGRSQYAYAYGDGIKRYGTASHGGFKLDAKRNAQVHPALRADDGFYEHDCEWAVVAHTFPQRFTTYERKLARDSLLNWKPDEYAAATGETVLPEQSLALRQRAFDVANAGNWVSVSAMRHDADRAYVEVSATLGGKRPGHGEQWNDRTFLVPAAEYGARSEVGFVIDLERHEELVPHAPAPGM